MSSKADINGAIKLMAALMRQPPRLHEDMKIKKTPQAMNKKERPASD
jgi:hypothetical protein